MASSIRSVSLFVLISLALTKGDEVLEALEKQGAELNLDGFAFDTLLEQKVDKANKVSTYKIPGTEGVIYTRDEDDSNKEVIALKDTEDKIGHKKNKRIYIVLRKKSPGIYYVASAAVRDASDLDKSSQTKITIGKEKVVEWLTFDTHLFPSKNMVMITTYFCIETFMTPCFFNASVLVPPEKFVKSSPHVSKVIAAEVDNVKLETTDGSDAEESWDFYGDLEFKTQEGRMFGFVGDIVGSAVGGAFGIACGVVGVVLGANCGMNFGGGVQNVGTDTTIVVQGGPMGAYQQMGPTVMSPAGLGGLDPVTAAAVNRALMGRRKRQAAPDPSVDYPGWKTQYITPEPEVTLKHEGEIFYGFGNCPHSTIDPAVLENAKTDQEIVDFYLKVLRADCLADRVAVIHKLVADGTIKIFDKILHLDFNNPKLALKKLSLKETFELTAAAELHAFTDTYREDKDVKAPEKFTNPEGSAQISRTINFLTRFAMKLIKESRTRARPFMIHISRYLVLMLKSVLEKLHEDQQNLSKCAACVKDQELNKNDRNQVVGLLEFVRHGLSPIDKGQEPLPVFSEFFRKNLANLEKLATLYSAS